MSSGRDGAFSFAPLDRRTLPLLDGWLTQAHVARWYGRSRDAEVDPLGENRPVRCFIASLDGRPIGVIQMYRWTDFPAGAAAVGGRAGEIGIDYLIGEHELIGKGVGPAMITAFLRQFTTGRGDVLGIRVDVSEANERSWRCLERVGFRRERAGVLIDGQEGRHFIYVLDGAPLTETMRATVEQVVERIRSARPVSGTGCRILAIDGPGGAGKSALAVHVARELDDAPVIHTDDFAGWENPVDWYQRLLSQVLRPLADGSPARYQRYDWDRRQLAEWHEVTPDRLLIVEGVGSSRRVLRPYLSATVWVETSREERLRRGLARDGQAALPHWKEWMRQEDDYIAGEHPDATADLIVRGE